MNRFFRRSTAVISAGIMTVCAVTGSFVSIAADEPAAEGVKLIFNIPGNFEITDYEPDDKTSIEDFADMLVTANHCLLPEGNFVKEGYTFQGWTADGVIGYRSGGYFDIPEGKSEIVMNALWTKDDDELLAIKYDLVYKGEQLEKPFAYKDKFARPGGLFTPYKGKLELEHAYGKGYYCADLVEGENVLIEPETYLVMPDHPITLVPRFLEIVTFTYSTGDVDRVNGNPEYSFTRNEGNPTELADADRLSRTGFALTGWRSSIDGTVYKPGETIITPGEDVTWYAVWEPKDYTLVFIQGNGGENLKVPGTTDTTVICPEPTIQVPGKRFAGWKDTYSGDVYQANGEYFVYGALPGIGISLKAQWVDIPEGALTGDADGNGVVDAADASLVLLEYSERSTNGGVGSFNDEQVILADVNGDGEIDASDASLILGYYAYTSTGGTLPTIEEWIASESE